MDIIEKTEKFIKRELVKLADFEDNNMRMAKYRIEHSYRVANIGVKIAKSEGFDCERTCVACLLHDIGYSIDYKDKNDYKNMADTVRKLRGIFSKIQITRQSKSMKYAMG